MTIINTETMEENPNMIYGDTNREIEDKGDMIMHYITTQANVIKALKLQIKEEKEITNEIKKHWNLCSVGDIILVIKKIEKDNKKLQEEIKVLDHENKRLKHENEELKEDLYESEDDVDMDGSFKADCYICKNDYIAFGLVGGKSVCNNCYKPWYAGIELAKEECNGSG